MASQYYGINRGQVQTDVVEQNSSPSKAVELKVDLATGISKQEVLDALVYLENVVIQDIWPPA